jgi:hypothetical protein
LALRIEGGGVGQIGTIHIIQKWKLRNELVATGRKGDFAFRVAFQDGTVPVRNGQEMN